MNPAGPAVVPAWPGRPRRDRAAEPPALRLMSAGLQALKFEACWSAESRVCARREGEAGTCPAASARFPPPWRAACDAPPWPRRAWPTRKPDRVFDPLPGRTRRAGHSPRPRAGRRPRRRTPWSWGSWAREARSRRAPARTGCTRRSRWRTAAAAWWSTAVRTGVSGCGGSRRGPSCSRTPTRTTPAGSWTARPARSGPRRRRGARSSVTLELPGPVLGRDEAFHLYIRLSDEPDRRLIGRFRVEVRRW